MCNREYSADLIKMVSGVDVTLGDIDKLQKCARDLDNSATFPLISLTETDFLTDFTALEVWMTI
jgi:hypothetical protein